MPIYEYRCEACGRVSSFLLLRVSEEIVPFCKTCGSKDMKKLISRVAVLKSEERRMESLLDPSKFSDLDENDPVSIERAARRMERELGDELGQGFGESVEDAMQEEGADYGAWDGED
ncbi:MAG: zinc ribbon domain-containing protein [Syntrophobacterales bacterium]|jgi:putative FmdB family regulatory protein|nr:zinc ribbon domain-containing protein [Syntrophobacterales bacterium]